MSRKIRTGDKTINALYEATRDYVENNGGSIAVIGGIGLMDGETKYKYSVLVHCLGTRPTFSSPKGKKK